MHFTIAKNIVTSEINKVTCNIPIMVNWMKFIKKFVRSDT